MVNPTNSQERLAQLEVERARLVASGWYLQGCWLVQVTPGGTARTNRQYWQVRSRQPIFDGKRLKHLKTEQEVNDYRAAIERGRQLRQIDREIKKLQPPQPAPDRSIDRPKSTTESEIPASASIDLESMVQAVIATSRQLRASLRQTLHRSQMLAAKNQEIKDGVDSIVRRRRSKPPH